LPYFNKTGGGTDGGRIEPLAKKYSESTKMYKKIDDSGDQVTQISRF
jgi:hypothetical protein